MDRQSRIFGVCWGGFPSLTDKFSRPPRRACSASPPRGRCEWPGGASSTASWVGAFRAGEETRSRSLASPCGRAEQRRGARKKRRACLSAASLRASLANRAAQGTAQRPGLRLAFLLLTFGVCVTLLRKVSKPRAVRAFGEQRKPATRVSSKVSRPPGRDPARYRRLNATTKKNQATRATSSPLSYRFCIVSRLCTCVIFDAMPAAPKAS